MHKQRKSRLFLCVTVLCYFLYFLSTEMDIVSNQFEDAGILLPGQYCFQVGSPGPKQLKKIAEYMEVIRCK